MSKTDWGNWLFHVFLHHAHTHDPLWKKIKFCLDLGLILEEIGEPWGTFFCSMFSWERSWEVETKARSGRVRGRNHSYSGTDNSLRSDFFLELNLLLYAFVLWSQPSFSMTLSCFLHLLTHMTHLGKKFWRSFGSLGEHFCVPCLLGSVLEK